MARSRLSQMPRSVECKTTQNKGQVLVTWESVDSYRHKDKPMKIVLHMDSCIDGNDSDQVPLRDLINHLSDDGKYPNHTFHGRANRAQSANAIAQVSFLKLSATA
jgi:hypothetical protein